MRQEYNNMSLTRELETLFFIILASAIGLFAVFYMKSPKHFNAVPVVASLPTFITADPTPTPVITSPIPKITTMSWTSSDGVEKIIMQTTESLSVSTTYSFTVTNTTTNTTTPLFTQTIPGTSSMTIPFNVFSSDDSYLFLTQVKNGVTDYLVFKTSGQPFADGQNYLTITPLFSAYTSQYVITDVTGWASPTLLVINTKKQDGNMGPSFWLDVPSKSFIPLATLFE